MTSGQPLELEVEMGLLDCCDGEEEEQTPPRWLRPSRPSRRFNPLLLLPLLLLVGLFLLSRPFASGTVALEVAAAATEEPLFKLSEKVVLPPEVDQEEGGEAEVVDMCTTQHGCRFLVPNKIGEQESRAHFHLLQLAALAHSLNRTLVLPHARSSRFATCGNRPFDFLYSFSSFAAATSPASSVLQADFERWLDDRSTPVKTQVLRLATAREDSPDDGHFVRDASYDSNTLKHCFSPSQLSFTPRSPLMRLEPWKFDGKRLVADLRTLDAEENADVLLLHYDLRGPLFPKVRSAALSTTGEKSIERAFAYREEWEEVADGVLEMMGGGAVVGVHWRTESLEAERLGVCGESLERALLAIKKAQPDVEAVYLASDFPIESLEGSPSRHGAPSSPSSVTAHSDTLSKQLTPAHFTAMSSFLTSFSTSSSAASLTLHTFTSLLPSLLRTHPALARYSNSPAAHSIVDLLVLERTEVFLAGFSSRGIEKEDRGRGVCARRSNWTLRVERAREERWKEQIRREDESEGVVFEEGGQGGRRLRNVMGVWTAEGRVERVPGVQL
ncbi:hypothetical protein JCM6882_003310 [Rhodosporidiobolus microsporus]